mmetsp:Transcript_2109/g.3168  ORF Transcript_2109/g.3168 Transcript_2109/m.3168 type:complete len:97 (-) Transcript_2109:545-835(-)
MHLNSDVAAEDNEYEYEYVVVDLPLSEANKLLAGSKIELQNLQSSTPSLRLEDGTVLNGNYEDHPGTVLLINQASNAEAEISQQVKTTEKILNFIL